MQRVSRVDTCTRSNLVPRRAPLPTRRRSGTDGDDEDEDEEKEEDGHKKQVESGC